MQAYTGRVAGVSTCFAGVALTAKGLRVIQRQAQIGALLDGLDMIHFVARLDPPEAPAYPAQPPVTGQRPQAQRSPRLARVKPTFGGGAHVRIVARAGRGS